MTDSHKEAQAALQQVLGNLFTGGEVRDPYEVATRAIIPIWTRKKNGKTEIGTGFIYKFDFPGEDWINNAEALITCRHVVEEAEEITVHLQASPGDGRDATCYYAVSFFPMQEEAHTFHPDAGVDICAIPMSSFAHQIEADGMSWNRGRLKRNNVPSPEKLSRLFFREDLVVIGYTPYLSDNVKNTPIMRTAASATPISKSYGNDPGFLVDMPCNEGFSGSPVFLVNPSGYLDRDGSHRHEWRFHIIGIFVEGRDVVRRSNEGLEYRMDTQIGRCIQSFYLFDLYDPFYRNMKEMKGKIRINGPIKKIDILF